VLFALEIFSTLSPQVVEKKSVFDEYNSIVYGIRNYSSVSTCVF